MYVYPNSGWRITHYPLPPSLPPTCWCWCWWWCVICSKFHNPPPHLKEAAQKLPYWEKAASNNITQSICSSTVYSRRILFYKYNIWTVRNWLGKYRNWKPMISGADRVGMQLETSGSQTGSHFKSWFDNLSPTWNAWSHRSLMWASLVSPGPVFWKDQHWHPSTGLHCGVRHRLL